MLQEKVGLTAVQMGRTVHQQVFTGKKRKASVSISLAQLGERKEYKKRHLKRLSNQRGIFLRWGMYLANCNWPWNHTQHWNENVTTNHCSNVLLCNATFVLRLQERSASKDMPENIWRHVLDLPVVISLWGLAEERMNGRPRLMFVGSIIRDNPAGLVGDASLLEFYSAFEFANGGLLVDCWQRATVVAKKSRNNWRARSCQKTNVDWHVIIAHGISLMNTWTLADFKPKCGLTDTWSSSVDLQKNAEIQRTPLEQNLSS